jgi:hypothetical protein
VQPLRWVIVGVGGAAMLCLLALIVGVRQLDSLKMIAVLMIIAALGAWQLELQASQKRISTVAWLSLAVTILAAVTAWLVILLTLVADGIFGSAAVSAWTWWLVATTFICWLAFAVNAHLHRFGFGKCANYTYMECWAVTIIVLTLSVFAWQLFAAVLKP